MSTTSPPPSLTDDEPIDGPIAAASLERAPVDPPLTDWTLWPFEATSRPPWIVGLGITAAVFVVSIGFRVLRGLDGYGPGDSLIHPYFWTEGLNSLIIGYVATAHAIQRRGVLRDLARLQPVLIGSAAQHRERVRKILCVRPRALLIAGIVCGCALGVLPAIDDSYWLHDRPDLAEPFMIFLVLRNFVVGWIAGHAALTEVHFTRAYVRLGEDELDIDLFDLSPLGAFARKGQRGAISWLVVSTLVSLFWFGPASTSSNGFIVLVILALVTLVFLRPIHGAHRGIQHAKEAELGALRDELRMLQAGEREAPGDVVRNVRIAAAAALLTTIENVREWPIDAPALLRFGLFALLGLASWFGSAIVERLLDTVMG
jgi:hypothetical protein